MVDNKNLVPQRLFHVSCLCVIIKAHVELYKKDSYAVLELYCEIVEPHRHFGSRGPWWKY